MRALVTAADLAHGPHAWMGGLGILLFAVAYVALMFWMGRGNA